MHETNTQPHIRQQEHNGVTWIDVQNPGTEELKRIEDQYGLHPVHVRESLQPVQHTAVEHEKDYLFFVLREPRITTGRAHKLAVTQVGLFLGKDYVLTIHGSEMPFITEVWQQSERGEDYYKYGAGSLLYVLVNRLLNEIGTLTDGVLDELDAMEDRVFDDRQSDAERISHLRQKIVRLSRLIGPKRVVLQDLAEQIGEFTGHGASMQKYYASNTRTVNRLWEVIGEAKDTVEIFKDADFTTSTEQTNRTLAVLTIIFTLTIPTTVVGSLYGMNVLLPGGIETGPWTFLGRYTTAIVVLGASLLLAWAMYLYFRRKKWF